MNHLYKIANTLFKGHQRSVKAKKQILISFLVKGATVLISFLMVPITLNYVNKEQYGIWLALASILEWFSFFDIGLEHGLRNKLAESLARDETKKAKTYVSTAYATLTVIFGTILILFFIVNPFLDWPFLLNTAETAPGELNAVIIFTFSFFCMRFVLKLVFAVFYADQRPSMKGIVDLVRKIFILLTIIILTKVTEGSLFNLAFTFGFFGVAMLVVVNYIFFKRDYKAIRPSFKFVERSYIKDLLNLGVRFFIIGVAVLVIFSTDNFIIIQLFGPGEVPAYNIAHKYFGLITIGFGIICSPFWSAFTEAYTKDDKAWISRIIKKLVRIWLGTVLLGIFLLAISKFFFKLWVPEIEVPFQLSFFMLLYVIVLNWGTIFVNFINGINKIKLQLYTSIIAAVLNIPLSIFFAKTLGLGTSGVILASTVCVFYGPLIAPIQYRKLMTGKAKGLWNQ